MYSFSGCNATYTSGGNRVSPCSSSIWDHIKQSGHAGTLENFSIIGKSDNSFDLLIRESILNHRDRHTLNFQQSSIPMILF